MDTDPHRMFTEVSVLVTRFDSAEKSRAEFRAEMRERFDRGSARMDKLETLLTEVAEQTRKTNGRVTRLEDSDVQRRLDMLEASEISTRMDIVRAKTGLWMIGGAIGVVQAVGLTLLNWFLRG